MERRSFLKLSCGLGAGILLSSLGVSVLPIEAFAQELTKYDRIKTAKQSTSICCYCAVGCGLLCSTDTKPASRSSLRCRAMRSMAKSQSFSSHLSP